MSLFDAEKSSVATAQGLSNQTRNAWVAANFAILYTLIGGMLVVGLLYVSFIGRMIERMASVTPGMPYRDVEYRLGPASRQIPANSPQWNFRTPDDKPPVLVPWKVAYAHFNFQYYLIVFCDEQSRVVGVYHQKV